MSSEKPVSKTGLTYFWSKIVAYIENIFPMIGNTQMGTTAQTITGAIKEHNDKIGDTTMGTTAETLTGAIAEHEQDISDLNSNFKVVSYSKQYTIGASTTLNLYASDFNMSTPSGYTSVIALVRFTSGNNSVIVRSINPLATSASDPVMVLRSVSSGSESATCSFACLYSKIPVT